MADQLPIDPPLGITTGVTPCRAKRWDGEPAYDGPHEAHLFTYGPEGIYTGSCSGR